MSSDAARLLTPDDEARVFWRLRGRILSNLLWRTLRQARLRVTLVALTSGLLWSGLYALFTGAFQFLKLAIPHRDTYDQTVSALFGVFFASLMVMLVFSAGIILYSTLYRSREAGFLLTTPVSGERIFLYKAQEALLLSSWGFLLLGSPMLVSYGVVAHAPWYYFAMLVPLMVAFVYIPGSVGAIACLFVVGRLHLIRRHLAAVVTLLIGVIAVWLMWLAVQAPTPDLLTPTWFRDMIGRLSFSQHYLLPSWWLSAGLLQAARGVWGDAVMFLVLTISNALFCHQLSLWAASRMYRRSYGDLLTQGTARRRRYIAWIDRALVSWAFFLSPTMRLLIVKDLRLFRRDPVQWSQFLIFFGLLGLYFANLRRFHYDLNYKLWVNLISFLNVAVIGLLLATFTTRFIFPMISLEGRRFWILGLLPIRRETIVWSKFLFAALGSTVSCTLLVLLSDLVLRVAPLVVAIHVHSCLVLCVGLSAIAVGLGAAMPNLREDSPSKIAAGFGGTLNLVISSIYIIAVVLLTALPCHLYLSTQQIGTELLPYANPGQTAGATWWRSMLSIAQLKWLIVGGVTGSVAVGLLATVIPLRLGFRAIRRMEF